MDKEWKTFYFLISLYTIVLLMLAGCSKQDLQSCYYQYTAGVINGISGADSIRINEQNELTIDVTAPGVCVADINVTVTRITDSVYYVDANLKYAADENCGCVVKDHHFVRLYFSSPVGGTVLLTPRPGMAQSAGHTIKVY